MGWLYYDRFEDGPKTREEEERKILRLCTWQTDAYRVVPASICRVGSTFYVGARFCPPAGAQLPERLRTGYVPDADGCVVVALVYLTARMNGGWGYKDMDEMMGPAEDDAPPAFLATLSPLDGEVGYAHDWRKRCLARHPQTEMQL